MWPRAQRRKTCPQTLTKDVMSCLVKTSWSELQCCISLRMLLGGSTASDFTYSVYPAPSSSIMNILETDVIDATALCQKKLQLLPVCIDSCGSRSSVRGRVSSRGSNQNVIYFHRRVGRLHTMALHRPLLIQTIPLVLFNTCCEALVAVFQRL